MMDTDLSNSLYLGIDCGTQSLKIELLCLKQRDAYAADAQNRAASDWLISSLFSHSIHYDSQLSKYGKTIDGSIRGADAGEVLAPSAMFFEALEVALIALAQVVPSLGYSMKDIKGISASAQQHGSVYWKPGSAAKMQELRTGSVAELGTHFSDSFACMTPIWQDSSTTKECQLMEEFVGGAETMYSITGSRAHERFTAAQIAKRLSLVTDDSQCERVSLISNAIASVLIGQYAPIDSGDASGMNLCNISTPLAFDDRCLKAVVFAGNQTSRTSGNQDELVQNLKRKLGEIVPSQTVVGKIAHCFVERFGFSPECFVLAATGDNISSAACILRSSNHVSISLGTSHTLFCMSSRFDEQGSIESHVFLSPYSGSEPFLPLLCLKNGGLARAKICKSCLNEGKVDWERFDALVASVPAGNDGCLGFYWFEPEIVPHTITSGVIRYNDSDQVVEQFDAAHEARAIVESQVLALRLHAVEDHFENVIVTGGATQSKSMLQTIADVFQCEVLTLDVDNSAAVGAAIRCIVAAASLPFEQVAAWMENDGGTLCASVVCKPRKNVSYDLARYARLEQQATQMLSSTGAKQKPAT